MNLLYMFFIFALIDNSIEQRGNKGITKTKNHSKVFPFCYILMLNYLIDGKMERMYKNFADRSMHTKDTQWV